MTNKQRAFHLLRMRGAIKAVLHFSGGNDEGGVDSITLHYPPTNGDDDANKESLEVYYGDGDSYEWDDETKTHKRVPAPPKTADQDLAELLAQPIDDKYGSWAGEFTAWGTLTWDVGTGEVWLDEEYETPQYEHRTERF